MAPYGNPIVDNLHLWELDLEAHLSIENGSFTPPAHSAPLFCKPLLHDAQLLV